MTQHEIECTVSDSSKVYDGSADIEVELTPTNAVDGDDVVITAKATLPSADVGVYTDAVLSDITLSGEDAKYYKVSSGKFECNIEITAMDISEDDDISDCEYTGEAIEPEVTLMDGVTELTSDDYDVAYSNDTETGTATITVTGKEYYTGTKVMTFNIVYTSLEVLSGLDSIMTVHNNDGVITITPKDDVELPEIILYTAVYNADNKLVRVVIAEKQINEDGSIYITIPEAEIKDGESIAYMLWTVDLMKPVVNL